MKIDARVRRDPVVRDAEVVARKNAGAIQKMQNVSTAVWRVITGAAEGSRVRVSDAVMADRRAVCSKCKLFDGANCKLCGCFVKFKTMLATERCPDGRW